MEQAQPKHDRDAAVSCAEAFLRLAEPVVIRIGKDVPESTTQSRPFFPNLLPRRVDGYDSSGQRLGRRFFESSFFQKTHHRLPAWKVFD